MWRGFGEKDVILQLPLSVRIRGFVNLPREALGKAAYEAHNMDRWEDFRTHD